MNAGGSRSLGFVLVRERGPWTDPRSCLLYGLVAAQICVGAVLMLALGFTANTATFIGIWTSIGLIGLGMATRHLGHAALGGFLETNGLTAFQGLATTLILFPVTALSRHLADPVLAAADQAMGLDWPAYTEAMRPFVRPLTVLYNSFAWQPTVLLALLFALNRAGRAWLMLTATSIALILVVMIHPFFPAEGPFKHYGYTSFEGLQYPWEFGPIIERLQKGARYLPDLLKTGIVTFPSVHTSGAILYIWAAWPTKLRWPFVVLNVAMLFSIPTIGGHYFIDMVGGGVVALAAIGLAHFKRGETVRAEGRFD